MKRKSLIGGQAVLEGVMMRGGSRAAIAVRDSRGNIVLRRLDGSQYGSSRVPLVRGVINFVAMLRMGVECLTASVEMSGDVQGEEPSRFEKWLAQKTGRNVMDVVTGVAVVLGLAVAVGLFFILPNLLTALVSRHIQSPLLVNLVEGAIRMLIFIGYLAVISAMPDIRRFFAYHGAEHRTINCYEQGRELTVKNVQSCSVQHARCGTSFILVVMVLSVLIFSLTGWSGPWYGRLLIRLALLPVVAALSYELLMLLARWDSPLARALRWPGMLLQRMTTRRPDDGMAEVAIAAFVACLPPEEWPGVVPAGYCLPIQPVRAEAFPSDEPAESPETPAGEPAPAEPGQTEVSPAPADEGAARA